MSLIVIVDDRVTNRNIFAKLAASIEPEVTVQTFGDPKEALLWLESAAPDLVITDYKMPHYDGAEFIRRFRQIPGADDIPVIVITVYEERSFRLCALEAGATDFLHSPVDHHEFVTRARNLLKLHKHQMLLADRATSLARELEDSERSRELALRDSSQRLAQVIDTLPMMINATARDGAILFVNARQTDFAGLDPLDVVGKTASALCGEEPAARSLALDRLVFETGKALPAYEEELTDAKGDRRIFLTTKSPLLDDQNRVASVLTSALDITDRKRAEAHLRHLAHYDALTDLPNRTLLRERMGRLIARARRGEQTFALHLLDLDGFKKINDHHGHAAGDRYICAMARRLQGVLREEDTLARLGGDEFAVLQTHVTDSAQAGAFAQRLLDVVGQTRIFDDARVRSTGSIGIAFHPGDGADGDELMVNADRAMYRAKANGGDHFCFFAHDMKTRAQHASHLESDLRRALERGEFELRYQPQVEIATGRVMGAEALVRWNRPGGSVCAPAAFLARAEETGLAAPLGEWVLREACRAARAWQKMGAGALTVSVNVSPAQFRARNMPLLVARVLGETDLDPRQLDLELTEGMIARDMEAVAADLKQLRDMGVRLSIDDFGSGDLSLPYARRLPITRLKIDQSFVRGLCDDTNDAAIVRAIVTLGHSLELEVLAEGVETQEQVASLRDEGCDLAQGHLFGKPMREEDFLHALKLAPQLAKSA